MCLALQKLCANQSINVNDTIVIPDYHQISGFATLGKIITETKDKTRSEWSTF